MNATTLDLRKNMKSALAALDRGESVTLTYRGREKATIIPRGAPSGRKDLSSHPAFGMWADREDMADVAAYARGLRKGRV